VAAVTRILVASWCVVFCSQSAAAEDSSLTESQKVQLEEVRAEIAAQVQFQAYTLLDELIFDWSQHPVFETATPVVLADVSVPVSFGSGLQALIENHVTTLLMKNTTAHVTLVHCPACTAMVVHSGSKGTIVSRGVDDPQALIQAGLLTQTKHALFLDFEMEGEALVLRARITSLEPTLPIAYAKTVTTTTSVAALLRDPEHLKSAKEARTEYLDILENRSRYSVPVHFGLRTYAKNNNGNSAFVPVPFFWLEIGIEAALTQARAWLGSFSLGLTWLPQAHIGASAHARIARLITGSASSLTHPDLYGFIGGSLLYIQGNSALGFRDQLVDFNALLNQARSAEPQVFFGAFQLGLELRLKNRIGLSAYLESLPALDRAVNVGSYIDLGLIKFHSFGVEVLFCF
jgi:hypothetical protein